MLIAGPKRRPSWRGSAMTGWPSWCARHPDRFAGYIASLPMNAPDAAAREAERAFANGANGLQLHTNVNGRSLADPRFEPVFEVGAHGSTSRSCCIPRAAPDNARFRRRVDVAL